MIKILTLLVFLPSIAFAGICEPPEPEPPARAESSTDDSSSDDNQCERHMIGTFEVCKNNGTGGGVLFQSHTPTHPYNHGH